MPQSYIVLLVSAAPAVRELIIRVLLSETATAVVLEPSFGPN